MAEQPSTGCDCEPFAEAIRHHFIEERHGRFFLGDRSSGGVSGWSITYGPEIHHCPFCGARLTVE